MPIPRSIARLNRLGVNRLTRRVAPWLPGFGVVVHQGRKSGRNFQTPVNVFPTDTGYLIALTYGTDSDWLKNVLAAGGCVLLTGGKTDRTTAPIVIHDETRADIRLPERPILKLLHVADFLRLDRVAAV